MTFFIDPDSQRRPLHEIENRTRSPNGVMQALQGSRTWRGTGRGNESTQARSSHT